MASTLTDGLCGTYIYVLMIYVYINHLIIHKIEALIKSLKQNMTVVHKKSTYKRSRQPVPWEQNMYSNLLRRQDNL